MDKAVFISHSSKDLKLAKSLCEYLEERKITCWIAPRDLDIAAGKPYGAGIMQGIKATRIMVVVLTQNANASDRVQDEISVASGKKKLIIPFNTEPIVLDESLELILRRRHWIKVNGGEVEDYFDKIYNACLAALATAPLPEIEDVNNTSGVQQEGLQDDTLTGPEITRWPFHWTKIAALLAAVILVAGILGWRLLYNPPQTTALKPAKTSGDDKYITSDIKTIRTVLLRINSLKDTTEKVQKEALDNAMSTYFNPHFIVNVKYDKSASAAVPEPGREYLSGLYVKNQVADIRVTRLVSTNHKIDSIEVTEIHKKPHDIKIIK
ncbi:toll/interleukin-1 receptor domain-containing protein [Mucilaginibacter ginsenosidivorax]|uniref:Toll/interleukin-1 receptor domain-containing protein n=1 Tax=Mucilaginibacter ginsenosidivorax TaxID=862126 RepID=A0A5B8VYK8_9SPHI|nr:toll/interleukin-1 receptor domain-containing protein [Mucilaginibacter ginsenosidivorax]QEC76351.1 toll/interleukin-1 receptor domain-containing protein [Mucilaginibacter ginsenosidivorax]